MNAGAIERLGQAVSESHAQEASVGLLERPALASAQHEHVDDPEYASGSGEQRGEGASEAAEIIREAAGQREQAHDLGREIE
jgi:hypothetical protein